MELKNYLDVLKRRKWVLILSVFIVVAVSAAGSFLTVPQYEATATLRVAAAADRTMDYSDYQYTDRLINTYAKIITSSPVLEEVMRRFNLTKVPEVTAEAVADTELITIVVQNTNPVLARDIANALAEELVARSKGLYTGDSKSATDILGEQLAQVQDELTKARADYEKSLSEGQSSSSDSETFYRVIEIKQRTYAALLEQYEEARIGEAMRSKAITIVEPATVPEKPSNPNIKMNLLIGLAAGVIGSIGLAFLLDSMDTTLYTLTQVKSVVPMSILGQIPTSRNPLIIQGEGPGFTSNGYLAQQEAYRRVRTNIFSVNHDCSIKIILATSPEPSEGKSTIVANLAKSIAQTGWRVAVVDGDLRRPTLHTKFNVPNEIGLSDVLQGKASLQEALRETPAPNVSILTSGSLPENPTELLSSPQASRLIKELSRDFSYVLVDTPAILPVIDAAVLAPSADGVLLIVRQEQTHREAVQAALDQLAEAKARPLGIVINGTSKTKSYY